VDCRICPLDEHVVAPRTASITPQARQELAFFSWFFGGASLSLYHGDVLAALCIRLNQFGNTVVEGGEFAFVVLSQG